MNTRVKINFQEEKRIFTFNGSSFQEFQQAVGNLLSIPTNNFVFFYEDDEGDTITVSSEGDFKEASRQFNGKPWKISVEKLNQNLNQTDDTISSDLIHKFESVQVVEDNFPEKKALPTFEEVEEKSQLTDTPAANIDEIYATNSGFVPSPPSEGGIHRTKSHQRVLKKYLKNKKKEHHAEKKREKLAMKAQQKLEKKKWKNEKLRILKNETLLSDEQLQQLKQLKALIKEKKELKREQILILKVEIHEKKNEIRRLKRERREEVYQLRKGVTDLLVAVAPQDSSPSSSPPNYEEALGDDQHQHRHQHHQHHQHHQPCSEKEKEERKAEKERIKLLHYSERAAIKKERKEAKKAFHKQKKEHKHEMKCHRKCHGEPN